MNKTKIIVVEDNIVYCEYVCNMLSREGYRNMKAYHLSTAKKHLQQATDNDIVVADLRLPDGSGIDLLCWMRKEGKTQASEIDIPCLSEIINCSDRLADYPEVTSTSDLRSTTPKSGISKNRSRFGTRC